MTNTPPEQVPRNPVYNVGGMPPYGMVGTPAYNAADAPAFTVPAIAAAFAGQSVLYERQDWGSLTDTQKVYVNPPFAGVGSTGAGRVPSWMQGSGDVKRILRGYIRNNDVVALDDPNLFVGGDLNANEMDVKTAVSTNARLYFMYNPEAIDRGYASYADVSAAVDPTHDSSGVPPFSLATAQFELFFDREEEVAAVADNPGVLVDLHVFDLLIGANPGTLSSLAADPAKQTTTSAIPDVQSLWWDPARVLVVVISPSLAFRGTLSAVSAHFEKFSHRMTPTRMRILITLRLQSVGPKPDINVVDFAKLISARNAANTTGAIQAEVDPSQLVEDQVQANTRNVEGRNLAVLWARQWVHIVPYIAGTIRCDGSDNDVVAPGKPPQDPPPKAFDCSAYVWRAYHVVGWIDWLGWGAMSCNNSNSSDMRVAATSIGETTT